MKSFLLKRFLFLFFLLFLGCGVHGTKNDGYPGFWNILPPGNQNNLWYKKNNSNTVIVFVHGIFSDSRKCWLYKESNKTSLYQYWPHLITTDDRFNGVSIFLAGYFTSVNSGNYGLNNCADEVYDALIESHVETREKVLDKKNILFVCHSTGGIVTRKLLVTYREAFIDKNVGIVLIASPSYGSKKANSLSRLSKIFNNKLALQLKWSAPELETLDDEFRLLLKNQPFELIGVEGYENKFIFKPRLFNLFNSENIVTKETAVRYFGESRSLANTDHFSAVKPNDKNHPAYKLLLKFYQNDFEKLTKSPSSGILSENKPGNRRRLIEPYKLETVIDIANTTIQSEISALKKLYKNKFNILYEDMSRKGQLNGTPMLGRLSELCLNEIEECALLIRNTLLRIKDSGVSYSDELAAELKNVVKSHLTGEIGNISGYIKQKNRLGPTLTNQLSIKETELNNKRTNELRKINSEIDLLAISLKNQEKESAN